VSQKALFSYQYIAYTVSSFFELHGKHEECIHDLESSLKAMFGIIDLYKIVTYLDCKMPSGAVSVPLSARPYESCQNI